ncbi:MAG: 2-isopropylmalate synthase, partial [Oscillospiraceae bacterium]|nr:2-isopropylmalate synthase [Oscillospiraceae bacterium]
RLEQLGFALSETELDGAFTDFKALTDAKHTVNDADIEKLVQGQSKRCQLYSLYSFVVNSGSSITATASVKLEHSGAVTERVARGETPTIAVFNAIDKIIGRSYPLHHFSIQSISEGRRELSEATVQVWNGDKLEIGRGLNTDIVQASVQAYLSAVNKALIRG